MGAGMAMTGFVTAFPLLVVSQCLWGLGWAIASGADVAWITDELDRPDLIDRVLTAQGRFDLLGTAVGIIAFGILAWATTLAAAMVVAGVSMIGLGLATVARWPESSRRSEIVGDPRYASVAVLTRGVAVARADRMIVLVLASTLLVNGGAEGFGRLFERRLIGLGVPASPDPIVWFAALALVAAALGATTLLFVEARIAGVGVARRTYVAACGLGTVGLVVFAQAPDVATAVAGALLVKGIAFPTVRVAGTILVNRRTPSEARATVHSLLSLSENAGEIVCGLALAAIAGATSSTVMLMASAALMAMAGLVVSAARDDPRHDGAIVAQEPTDP